MTKWTRNVVLSAVILTIAGAVLVPEPVAAEQVRVAVIKVVDSTTQKIEYRVRPATVILNSRGAGATTMWVTNYTDLPLMEVTILGEGVEAKIVEAKEPENLNGNAQGKPRNRVKITFKNPGGNEGDYEYRVRLSQPDGTGAVDATGESSPHVIIDP